MESHLAREVIECLTQTRSLFHYFKDRYALLILARVVGAGTSVGAIKRSPFAPLLTKVAVRDILGGIGDGVITRDALDMGWREPIEPFVLTLGTWGSGRRSWDQTSRSGTNLVLQLNFSHREVERFLRLVKPHNTRVGLNCDLHPVQKKGGARDGTRMTLAWARIDVDFDTGEALIEEIQSDWISWVDLLRQQANRAAAQGQTVSYSSIGGAPPEQIKRYIDDTWSTLGKIWDEAMLGATIAFINDELGLKRIYYHTHESGRVVKRLGNSLPPRSLYTRLPRRFCFDHSDAGPEFLQADPLYRRLLRKVKNVDWFRLELDRPLGI